MGALPFFDICVERALDERLAASKVSSALSYDYVVVFLFTVQAWRDVDSAVSAVAAA